MNQKTLIIIDFDHTIFNTTEFVKDLKQVFKQEFIIDNNSFDEVRNQVKNCCTVIDVDTFVTKLPNKNKKLMHDRLIDFVNNNGKKYIFDDVNNFFKKHISNKDIDITIMTHGDNELQSHKIASAFLPGKYNVLISTNNKSTEIKNIINNYKKILFIDDKSQNIIDVKTNFNNVKTYFIQRLNDAPYKVNNVDQADYVITNLNEIEV